MTAAPPLLPPPKQLISIQLWSRVRDKEPRPTLSCGLPWQQSAEAQSLAESRWLWGTHQWLVLPGPQLLQQNKQVGQMNLKVGASYVRLPWFLAEKRLSLEQCKNKMVLLPDPASSCLVAQVV